jgi:hypothetical protein
VYIAIRVEKIGKEETLKITTEVEEGSQCHHNMCGNIVRY